MQWPQRPHVVLGRQREKIGRFLAFDVQALVRDLSQVDFHGGASVAGGYFSRSA